MTCAGKVQFSKIFSKIQESAFPGGALMMKREPEAITCSPLQGCLRHCIVQIYPRRVVKETRISHSQSPSLPATPRNSRMLLQFIFFSS